NGLVSLGNEVPRSNGLPSRLAHRLPECACCERLLHSKHEPGLDRIDVTREMIDEIGLRQPCVALLVDIEMCDRRGWWSLGQDRAQRFALVKAEGSDINETGDIWRLCPKGGHDLPAV